MDLSRTVLHYEPRAERDAGQLRVRITELAAQRRRFGYRRICALLHREGRSDNIKRVHCAFPIMFSPCVSHRIGL
jgi:putative transposase